MPIFNWILTQPLSRVKQLSGAAVWAMDLRDGAAGNCWIAAYGPPKLRGVEHIMRGYEVGQKSCRELVQKST